MTERGALSGFDSLPISAFGVEGTTIANGTTVNTTGLNPVTVSDGGTNGFTVLQQNDLWTGNFADGDLVLWTGNINTLNADGGPVTLTFGTPVGGVGLQIQPNGFTGFTASIDVFDSTSSNIGSFTENGISTAADDNSAIFLGAHSTSANIKSISINITNPAGVDFAFNELTFGSPLPEPASIALVLLGAGMLSVLARRRAKNN